MLVSIGMVADDGRELYAINADLELSAVYAHPWLRAHVYPHLPLTSHAGGARCRCVAGHLDRNHPDVHPRAKIARMVQAFITATPQPRLWAWYGAYDHVVMAQLFGTMADLPGNVPMYTCDVKQECDRLGNPQLPEQTAGAHHALADARHVQRMRRFLADVDSTFGPRDPQ
ncbi:3'-5' exoribonuclease [Planobispora siamensis]